MNVTRDEAAEALSEIGQASGKVTRLQAYRHSSVYFIVWGLVWLVANTVSHFRPADAAITWLVAIVAGVAVSLTLGVVENMRRRARSDGAASPAPPWKVGAVTAVYFGFFVCLIAIVEPQSGVVTNAMISIFFAFVYMAAGVWFGWRLFGIGLVMAIAIMGGFYFLRDVFSLWMGVVGGGALIAGGLWLRSA